jgi:lysophospholipase L1-like esterase
MKTIRWVLTSAVIIVLVDCLLLNPLFLKLSAYRHDEVIGWVPKKSFKREYMQKDAAGKSYTASFALDQNGFRAYGTISTSRKKLLFVGDSYTGDPYVGNAEAYFSVVKEYLRKKYHLDVEIFAAGGGGYSTLQEYLLIKEQISIIKPDIFILQFCENDFVNNHPKWEQTSIVKNQAMLRPYFDPDTHSQGRHQSIFARLYRFSYTNSFLFRRIDGLLQMLLYRYHNGYSKPLEPVITHNLRVESYMITKEILELIDTELPEKSGRFIVNVSTMDEPSTELWENMSRETGFTPLFNPAREIEQIENAGGVVRHSDGGHMNNAGNRIFGEALAHELYRHMKNLDSLSARGVQHK